MGCIWNAQTPHTVGMPPFLQYHAGKESGRGLTWWTVCVTDWEVSLEGLRSAISCITTDLTGVGDVQTVQLVQPVRDWLQETERHLKHDKQTSRHLPIYKATQHNATTPEEDFSEKNQLPQVGLEPTTLCSLDWVLCQLSYWGSTAELAGMNLSNQGNIKAIQPDRFLRLG